MRFVCQIRIEAIVVVASFVFAMATVVHAEDKGPKFLVAQSTLQLCGKTISPQAVHDPWVYSYRARERRFVLHGDTVEEIGGESQKPTWSIKAPGGLNLRWLAATDAQAFFQAFKPEKEGASAEPETPLRVQRLDIAARKWVSPLELLAAKPQPNRHDTILAVLAKGKLVVVLTESWIESERSFDSPKSMTYRVSYFQDGQEKPAWSKEFASGGTRPAPGVGLWATRKPDYAASDIQHLQWLGDDILVCAGEKDDILCLSADGKTKWKIERIWEFERGFTGPSVWSHHIGPFRRSSWELPRDDAGRTDDKKTPDERKQADEIRKSLAKEREEFNRQFECAIVGGPVVLPAVNKKEGAARGMFVAVAKGPSSRYWGYLSDCIVYELSASGGVAAMVNLPRMVNGHQFGVVPDGVVWSCQQDALVRLAIDTSSAFQFFGGPGGPDLISRISWYRQYAEPERKAWFKSGKGGDSTAFGSRYAFRGGAGGFIADKKTKLYSFPISIVDLSSGVDRTALLQVPFEGEFPLPTENVSTVEDTTEAMGAYLLAVTYLQLDGERLEIVLGQKGSAIGLTFDVKSLEAGVSR